MSANPLPRPVCFMVMPYGKKRTDASPEIKAPAEINFDALWDHALKPAIEDLGYEPIRADQDIGALIVKEMLERLYFADLIVADMTIPNGNVYYEVGIRHAAKEHGCVLVAAEWSRPLFDVQQMRHVRYPLLNGDITGDDATATAIRQAVRDGARPRLAGKSPFFQTIDGYPDNVDDSKRAATRAELDALGGFQARVAATRAIAGNDERKAAAVALAAAQFAQPPISPVVANGLVKLLRDCGAWQAALDLVAKLEEPFASSPHIVEIREFARSQTGDHLASIGALEALIKTSGATSEREGLIGGPFKRLWRVAKTDLEKRRYLNQAIAHYEQGMMLNLNDYFPSSNLPRLYMTRGAKGDADKARGVAQLVYHACQRAKARGAPDPWLRPTLLAAAFDAADVDAATALYEEVVNEGPGDWQLESVLRDLDVSLKLVDDAARRAALEGVRDGLRKLL